MSLVVWAGRDKNAIIIETLSVYGSFMVYNSAWIGPGRLPNRTSDYVMRTALT